MNGPHIPTHTMNNIMIFKSEANKDDHDKRMTQLNAKAVNIFYCILDVNEFNRISICTSAKKIWDRLEVTHEETNEVKESKINMLVHKYELFKLESDETIIHMFTCFIDIVNNLKNLSKCYTDSELSKKIL